MKPETSPHVYQAPLAKRKQLARTLVTLIGPEHYTAIPVKTNLFVTLAPYLKEYPFLATDSDLITQIEREILSGPYFNESPRLINYFNSQWEWGDKRAVQRNRNIVDLLEEKKLQHSLAHSDALIESATSNPRTAELVVKDRLLKVLDSIAIKKVMQEEDNQTDPTPIPTDLHLVNINVLRRPRRFPLERFYKENVYTIGDLDDRFSQNGTITSSGPQRNHFLDLAVAEFKSQAKWIEPVEHKQWRRKEEKIVALGRWPSALNWAIEVIAKQRPEIVAKKIEEIKIAKQNKQIERNRYWAMVRVLDTAGDLVFRGLPHDERSRLSYEQRHFTSEDIERTMGKEIQTLFGRLPLSLQYEAYDYVHALARAQSAEDLEAIERNNHGLFLELPTHLKLDAYIYIRELARYRSFVL